MAEKVAYRCDAFGISGYANSSRINIALLDQLGVDLYLQPVNHCTLQIENNQERKRLEFLSSRQGNPDILISHMTPDCYRHNEYKYRIGITYYEATKIPNEWVDYCNFMNEIWLSCHMNMEVFKDCGVKSKLTYIKPGIDTKRFNPHITPMPIENRKSFVFLSVFHFTRRKGWDILVKAFAKAFKKTEDVCLLIRTYKFGKEDEEITRSIKELIGSEHAPILLSTEPIPNDLMPSLYPAADAFVLPSRGEAVGLPVLEAMASEIPCIATNWSSLEEFMKPDISYPLSYSLKPAIPEPHAKWYKSDQLLAEVNEQDLINKMRYVFENYKEAKAKAIKSRVFVESNYDLLESGISMVNRLQEIRKSL